jgi:hypothetical protein
MAARKKSKKKTTAKKSATKLKKSKAKRSAARRKAVPKPRQKRAKVQRKTSAKVKPSKAKSKKLKSRKIATKGEIDATLSIPSPGPAKSKFGDSIGVSDEERADSESVSELLDEGNTFEAGVVSGVQRADDADESEVRTREFPEDDVPEEYLDND